MIGSAAIDLPEWASRLVIAAIVVAAAIALLALFGWLMPRLSRRMPATADPARFRQRQTALALLGTGLRYLVVIAAVLAVAVVLAGGGGLGAIGGTALLVVVVGFASQRLLVDVIAGFFILFESQYGVGDFVRLEPAGCTGVVEELGLRTTVLRELNGDLCFVPNGQITAVRRVPLGRRTLTVELVTRDPDAVEAAVAELSHLAPVEGARFLRVPRVEERRPLGEGRVGVRVTAVVAPSLEWLMRDVFLPNLRARVGDLLEGEPVVSELPAGSLERYEAGMGVA